MICFILFPESTVPISVHTVYGSNANQQDQNTFKKHILFVAFTAIFTEEGGGGGGGGLY